MLFDINGDRQIQIQDDEAPGFTTNVIANVAVWTLIPGTRRTDSSGTPEPLTEEVFGSWGSFNVK